MHTVGPVWHGGDHGEAAPLASCYRRSIEVALDVGCDLDRVPRDLDRHLRVPAARRGRDRGRDGPRARGDELELVRLVAFDERTQRTYEELLSS